MRKFTRELKLDAKQQEAVKTILDKQHEKIMALHQEMTAKFDALREIDHLLFKKINAVWTCPWLDRAMPVITDLHKVHVVAWIILPLSLACWLYFQRGSAVRVLLGLVLVIGMTDLVAHRIIKPLVHRARPEHSGVAVVLLGGHHDSYGFPSNHASNMFAMATFLGSAYPSLRTPLFAAAILIAYSRVYVGAHFPLDVLGGALLGLMIGGLGSLLYRNAPETAGEDADSVGDRDGDGHEQ